MVYVGDKKYACETCIKGHRSSSCKHTDRPLFEIKKKGRPVTQCEHCRELRKTRQIHVKCVCESKESGEVGQLSSSKGGTKLPTRATFPGGLPEELLDASAASHPFSEGSDSDHSSRECSCKEGATCTCWTPRTRAKQPAKASGRRASETQRTLAPAGDPISQPAALVVHAHSGGERPVLPKPPVERPGSPFRTSHDPSSTQSNRLPTHGQSFYSPYSRAYDYVHGPGYSNVNNTSPLNLQYILNSDPTSGTSFPWPLAGDNGYPASPGSPPICGCGPSCACPGCVEHRGPSADPSAACANPNSCVACLDCNINALTALAAENSRAVYDPSQIQNIDDWLRQVSSMPDLPTTTSMQTPVFPPVSQSQSDLRYDPSMTQAYSMWSDPQGSQVPTLPQYSPSIPECCGGRCSCSNGLCPCPADCCGCCQGCQCSSCVHDGGSGRSLTFATSGERASCCGGGLRNHGPPTGSTAGSTAGPIHRPRITTSPPGPSATWLGSTLTVPRDPLSRASSSSSKSSPQPSASSSSPATFGDFGDMVPRASPMDQAVGSCCSSMGNLTTNPSGASSSHRRGSDHNEYRTQSSKHARQF
ncbi:hypothetical protein C8Q80DRAFT_483490 [Daedaleopsis nitida]|nr:hypothetical protein C8Q80DRAFT_483490 [Daedaleopsis nitida]